MRVQLLPKQREFLQCQSKWAAARGGVGSGKTIAMVWWLIRRMEEYPLANHVVCGPDYENLRRGFFPSMLGVLEESLGWKPGVDYHYRESPTPFIRFLHNGARLRSVSAEIALRLRGAEIQTLYCEEPQTWCNGTEKGSVAFANIASRLRPSMASTQYKDLREFGRMTFNPTHIGHWLYEMIERAWTQPGFEYPCWQMSLRENILMPRLDEYIKQIEVSNPEPHWPTEIDGEWATLDGVFFYGPDIDRAIDPDLTAAHVSRATDAQGRMAHCELYAKPEGGGEPIPWAQRYDQHQYVHFWDIGEQKDFTVGITLDTSGATTGKDMILVEYQRFNRQGFAYIIDQIHERHERYRRAGSDGGIGSSSITALDATGVGLAVADQCRDIGVSKETGRAFIFSASSKKHILGGVQTGLSMGRIKMPGIPVLINELRTYRLDDKDLIQDCVMSLAGAVEFGRKTGWWPGFFW